MRRPVRRRWRHDAAPGERLILDIALAEAPGDFGPCQLDAEIKGVRAVALDPELRIEREGVLRDVMAVAVIEMDAALARLDAEIGIADRCRRRRDLGIGCRKWFAIAQRHEAGINAD